MLAGEITARAGMIGVELGPAFSIRRLNPGGLGIPGSEKARMRFKTLPGFPLHWPLRIEMRALARTRREEAARAAQASVAHLARTFR